jgi:hypothetical protein
MEEALRLNMLQFLHDELKMDTWTMPDFINGKINLFIHDKLMPEIFGTNWPNHLLTTKKAMLVLKDYAEGAHWAVKDPLERAIKNVHALIDSNENERNLEVTP